MGFPGLSNVSTGLFAVLMINASLSMSNIKEFVKSILGIIGIWRDSSSAEEASDIASSSSSSSLNGGVDQSGLNTGLVYPSLWDEIRSSLPVTSYDPSTFAAAGEETPEHVLQCAVCLVDFLPGDDIHLLPRCSHVFHQGCIDKWLEHQQTTCPMCRSSLISEDLTWRYRRREAELVEELILWFSSFHGSAFHGLWWQT